MIALNCMHVSVAQRVVDRGPMQVSGCQLEISIMIEQPMVKISGITSDISEDILELFFENTKRSGGGDIKELHIYRSHRCAIITLEEPEGEILLHSLYLKYLSYMLPLNYICALEKDRI